MVLEDPLWQDGTTYPARLHRQFIEDVFNIEGVIDPSTGALRVAPRAAGANMSVDVAAGRAVIKGDDEANQGSYRVISTAVENVPIGAAPGSDRRIDLIVARVRDAAVTGGVSSDWLLEVIPGTVAASPVAPAVPSTAIPLAEVTVTSTTTSITAAEITKDRRTAAQNAAYLHKADGGTVTGPVVLEGTVSAPRLRATRAEIQAGETTNSTVYVDLATAGPTVFFIVPPSGRVVLSGSAVMTNNAAGGEVHVAPRIVRTSDAVEVAAPATNNAAFDTIPTANQYKSKTFRQIFELTPGVEYSASLRYRVGGAGGTGAFQNRRIIAEASL
jgi:hypothetical protein